MKRPFFIVLALLLTGCRAELIYSEVNIQNAEDDVKQFIEIIGDENGYYLYIDDARDVYIFLNEINVPLGRDAIYFTDFSVTVQQSTLAIFFNQESDSDLTNRHTKYQVLYKIPIKGQFETVNLIGNGKPIPFDREFTMN